MNSHLFVGAASLCITPSEKLLPNLRGLRDCDFGGILDDLFVRVIAIGDGENKALIVAFDLDKAPYPAENLENISKKTKIPIENIFFLGTHTHTAPVTGFRPEEKMNDVRLKSAEVQAATSEYEKQVIDSMFKTIDEAVNSMIPARMGYTNEKSFINVNRNQFYEIKDENGDIHQELSLGMNIDAPVDRTLFVMRFESLEGQPIAFFMNYPVHNCLMIGNDCCSGKVGISGDISGFVCRKLEDEFEGSIAIWSSGAAGDVNPLIMNEIFYPDPESGRISMCTLSGGVTCALTTLSSRHYADILRAIRNIVCDIDVAPISAKSEWSFTPGRDVVEHEDGSREIIEGDLADPYDIRLHLMRVGEIAFLGISGELYSSIGRRLKEVSPAKNTIIINHDASFLSCCNYIFDDETLYCGVPISLPGHRNSHILPGFVLESLIKHTQAMFEKV